MHTPQRPTGENFNRMTNGSVYMADAECAAQFKRITPPPSSPKNTTHAARQAQAMRLP